MVKFLLYPSLGVDKAIDAIDATWRLVDPNRRDGNARFYTGSLDSPLLTDQKYKRDQQKTISEIASR